MAAATLIGTQMLVPHLDLQPSWEQQAQARCQQPELSRLSSTHELTVVGPCSFPATRTPTQLLHVRPRGPHPCRLLHPALSASIFPCPTLPCLCSPCAAPQAHEHRAELYYHTRVDHLLWPRRWSLIKEEIEHHRVSGLWVWGCGQ